MTPTDSEFVWLCGTCSDPIEDGDGYVAVRFAEIDEHRQRLAVWREEHVQDPEGVSVFRGSALATRPRPAAWRGHHRHCDPFPDCSSYRIAVERIRSAAQFLEWAAHLGAKRWVASTDWLSVLRSRVAQLERPPKAPAA